MKNIFENLDQKMVGIFFASGKIFATYLEREKDQWKIFESRQVASIEELELSDLPICICLDSSAVESFRANIPEMPEEDLRGVIDNEILLRFKSREKFLSTYRKRDDGYEIFLIGRKFVDELKFKPTRITIFDPYTKFPIERGDSNERAFFGACSIAFPEILTMDLLPKDLRKESSRWNFKRLTLAILILALIFNVGNFFMTRNSLAKSQTDLAMLKTRRDSIPLEDPREVEISNRELMAIKIREENSDDLGRKFLNQLSQIEIDSVYVESFSRLEDRIKIKIVGEDIESITKFVAELKNLSGTFRENLAVDKDGSWILDLEVETQIETLNLNREGNDNVESELESVEN